MTATLAMHMANELLDLPVAAVTGIIAAAVLIVVTRAKLKPDSDKIAMMGVMGAFVFAAQMINFTLPGMPGTSGHLGGGVLLAILLGPGPAIIAMSSVVIVQSLIFQDGGLLAIGCNIINMGIVPCILGWAVYRGIAGRLDSPGRWRSYIAVWVASLLGVTAGAVLVPIEAHLAGRLSIPFSHFLAMMVGVHLLIGAIEGAITFTVVSYLRQVRPGLSGRSASVATSKGLTRGAVAGSLIVTALLLGGVISWFASSHPDGLEWSYLEDKNGVEAPRAIKPPTESIAAIDKFQDKYSPMPGYSKRTAALGTLPIVSIGGEVAKEDAWVNVDGWRSLAGILGTALTLIVLYLVSVWLRPKSDISIHQTAGT